MVRLLPLRNEIVETLQLQFQSHNGAIAAKSMTKFKSVNRKFQSHNGAIAASPNDNAREDDQCFNPTMVRLLRHHDFTTLTSSCQFQSHNGAIAATP